MKKIAILFVIIYFFTRPMSTSAHFANQQPFFKINDQYAGLYPVPTTSLRDFNLPQDLAPSNYLVNESLKFEVDTSRFPVTQDVIKSTKYTWSFGDGQKAEGLGVKHTYTKIGSYIITIYADAQITTIPQLFESVLINILPETTYQLPKAVIKINDQEVKDPLVDVLTLDFGKDIKLDATSSNAGSAKIVEYYWDFGDGQSANDNIVTHNYFKSSSQDLLFPVLRVKDNNGFIADTFAQINNQNSLQQNAGSNYSTPAQTNSQEIKKPSQLKYSLIGIVVLFSCAYAIRKLAARTKKQKQ